MRRQKQPLEVFYKKGVLKNFAKFTEKHLRQSLFFNKVAGLQFCEVSKNIFFHRASPVCAFVNCSENYFLKLVKFYQKVLGFEVIWHMFFSTKQYLFQTSAISISQFLFSIEMNGVVVIKNTKIAMSNAQVSVVCFERIDVMIMRCQC